MPTFQHLFISHREDMMEGLRDELVEKGYEIRYVDYDKPDTWFLMVQKVDETDAPEYMKAVAERWDGQYQGMQ